MMKLLLNKKRGKSSTNKDNFLKIGLDNEMKKIANYSDQHLVDVYQVYLDEKDASDKYRLIFTINPVCSNVLFNAITEVVYDEGSSSCSVVPNSATTAPDKRTYPNIISDEPISRVQAIRDTEYSNEHIYGLTYLPGIDIFNNHLLRQDGFNCVMKRTGRDCEKAGAAYTVSGGTFDVKYFINDVFNTIRDFQRTQDGNKIIRKFPGKNSTYSKPLTGQVHIYHESEILSFDDSVKRGLKENGGWFGFYNPVTLEIPVSTDKDDSNINIYINKLLNNRNACDFIDMFPDRTRFTFVPQKNRYRDNRLEKNWEYCLTYPYSATEDIIDENGVHVVDDSGQTVLNPIVAERDSSGNVRNGLSFSVVEEYMTDGDKRRVLLQSTNSIHNLHPNDKINLYYKAGEDGGYDEDGTFVGIFNVQVKGIGNKNGELQQYYFSVDSDDVQEWFNEDGELVNVQEVDDNGNLTGGTRGRFCKVVFGAENMYYFRVFRRLPNFNEISKDEDRAYYIGKYNKPEHDFNSEINKLAFANNIYGDNIVQILYLDDIDVNGLTDNLERPVSDIYLTIVKANDGHDLWYPESGSPVYDDERITIARPFGKVTSGIDLPPEDAFMRNYNVHRIHNIDFKKVCETYDEVFNRPYENLGNLYKNYDIIGEKKSTNDDDRCLDTEILKPLKTLEDDIRIDREFFLGDMVEFCIPKYEETILEPVYHRFNTAQREYVNSDYENILIDEIYMDDYEGSETGVTHDYENIEGNFKCVEESYNQGYENVVGFDDGEKNEKKLVTYPGNLFPEGYYYQPHYRIHLKDVSDKVSQSTDTQVVITENGLVVDDSRDYVYFTAATDYDLIVKDEIVIQDSKNNIFYDAIITNAIGVTGQTEVEAVLKNGMKINGGIPEEEWPNHFLVFKKTLGIPKYAIHYPDTGGKYVWRGLVPHSKVKTDSEIYDKPFANGAHYRHTGINFFLRRQDPYGYYELNTKTEYSTGETNKLNNFMTVGRINESIYYNDAIDLGLIGIC